MLQLGEQQEEMEQAEHPAQLKRAVHGRPHLTCRHSAQHKTESSYHSGRRQSSTSCLQRSRHQQSTHPILQQNAGLCSSCGAKQQVRVTSRVCTQWKQAGTCSRHVDTILLHLDNNTCR